MQTYINECFEKNKHHYPKKYFQPKKRFCFSTRKKLSLLFILAPLDHGVLGYNNNEYGLFVVRYFYKNGETQGDPEILKIFEQSYLKNRDEQMLNLIGVVDVIEERVICVYRIDSFATFDMKNIRQTKWIHI